jgi:hypothetical protein
MAVAAVHGVPWDTFIVSAALEPGTACVRAAIDCLSRKTMATIAGAFLTAVANSAIGAFGARLRKAALAIAGAFESGIASNVTVRPTINCV